MENDKTDMSISLYKYCCRVFGTEGIVKTRRKIYFAAEAVANGHAVQLIASGSRAEGLELAKSDFDLMVLYQIVQVHEKLSDISNYNCCNVLIDNDETKLGFTRLQLVDSKPISHHSSFIFDKLLECSVNYDETKYISSSAVRGLITFFKFDTIPHGPCQMVKFDDIEVESLACFRCKNWITVVTPWKIRSRGSWPNTQLINDITLNGVLFVPIGCKNSVHEDIEWRISFSIAEKLLIHSFTHTQFLCYAMMKTVLSDIIKKEHSELLCSYFIKTVMFWLSEEYNPSFWTKDNIIHCYMTCLKRLIYCVEYRICQHYFIPEINFFEGRFSDCDQKALLYTLNDVYGGGLEALLNTETFMNFRITCSLYENPYRDASFLSSCFAAFSWTYILLLGDGIISFIFKALTRDLKLTTISTWRMMSYVMAKKCLWKVEKNITMWTLCDNKQVYYKFKSMLPYILLGTRTSCVSGWCMLASLFYKLKLYTRCKFLVNDCLSKCTPEKEWLDTSTHTRLLTRIQEALSNGRNVTSVIQHYFLYAIDFKSLSLLPTELIHVFEIELGEGFQVSIPPVVYLHFLDFLCAYHLKQNRAKKCAFRNLHLTVRDKYFIVSETLMKDAEIVLKVAYSMLH